MPLSADFDRAAILAAEGGCQNAVPPPPKKRLAPFSIRLSPEERARLAVEAAGAPLGAYIKARVLGTVPGERKRRKVLTIKDREALAQALALLGRSHLSSNLNQLAYAVNIGSLPVTPEAEADLRAALADIRELRRLLLTALGFRPEGLS